MRRVPGAVVAKRVRKAVGDLRRSGDALQKDLRDAKALHEYRKQARRLWATVQLTEPYLTPLQHSQAIRLVAPLADGLGRLRDEDMLAKRVKALARGKSKVLRDALLEAAAPMSPAKRDRRIASALARARPKRLERPLMDILASIRAGWLDPLGLVRGRLRERSRWIAATSSLAALHALRLELKAYRYAVEALGKEAGVADARAARQAHEATKVLGRVMDADALAGLAAKSPPRVARTLLAAAKREGQDARREFGTAWSKRWPALRHVVVS